MNEECHSLMTNDTWDLVPLLKRRKIFIWVHRTKYASDVCVERYKAWLVSKGLFQFEGICWIYVVVIDVKRGSI